MPPTVRRFWFEFDLPSPESQLNPTFACLSLGVGVTGFDVADCLWTIRDLLPTLNPPPRHAARLARPRSLALPLRRAADRAPRGAASAGPASPPGPARRGAGLTRAAWQDRHGPPGTAPACLTWPAASPGPRCRAVVG